MNSDSDRVAPSGESSPSLSTEAGWLKNPLWLTLWCVTASFGTYACMYGFRKPFTSATFDESPFEPGMKTWLVTAQVLGYMVSKFIGIKVIAEMPSRRRACVLIGLIGVGELALLLFALVPPPYSILCLFLNGLPLGMVFGLVLGFLEGRNLSEAFVAGLCASFILADGFVKSVGAWLIEFGVSDSWMPFTAGLIFLLPLALFVWMLQKIPPPSESDVEARSRREPMNSEDRWRWIRCHGVGISLIVFAYLLITILRSIRADFAPELWRDLGTTGQPSVFALSEMWVALGVLLASGLVVFVSDNRRALLTALGIGGVGFCLLLLALAGLHWNRIAGFPFMVMVGLGMYLPYVVVHTTVFERLIALTRERGNVGYLLYLADAFGYLGYVLIMLSDYVLPTAAGSLGQFKWLALVVGVLGLLSFAVSARVLTRDRGLVGGA